MEELALPEIHGHERDSLIRETVADGLCQYKFTSITSKYKQHIATFNIFNDALKINNVRINVSAELQQQIADILGCILLTAKLADLIFTQATAIIPPKPRPITSTTAAMVEHSKKIDDSLKNENNQTLISTVGKHWIIDETLSKPKFPDMAINYGWHFNGVSFQGIKGDLPVCYKDFPNIKLIQSRGYHHNKQHSDYSQTCVLVSRECNVDGQDMDIISVLKDDELAYLASHSGRMTVWRQP